MTNRNIWRTGITGPSRQQVLGMIHMKLSSFSNWLVVLTLLTACGSVSNPEHAVNRLEPKESISAASIDSIGAVLSFYPNQTQLSIAFLEDSSARFYGAFRHRDTLRTIKNADNVFEIGSLSKVFTAALLADLVLNSPVSLDDPVQDHIEFALHGNPGFTLRQLANHTSGLPRIPPGLYWDSIWNMDNPYRNYDESELREYLSADLELEFEPGTRYRYSNLGVGLLGYVLSRVTGRSYEELLEIRLFRPLGMESSTTERAQVDRKLVTGLDKRGNATPYWNLASLKGAGAILSTAEDLAKFGIANLDQQHPAFQLQHKTTFTIDDRMDIALGWHILKQPSGEQYYWHNGGTGGFRSSMTLHLPSRTGIIVLSNISAGHSHAANIDELGKTLLKHLSHNPVMQKHR